MPDIWMDVDTALSEVPVNVMPLIDDTDFKSIEASVAYNAAGMDLVWNFVTTAGAFTQTAVTPTTAGDYDWTNQGDGMYTIEIPASGGASINNDTEGFGWFKGFATGVLPWRGPVVGFRASGLNNLMIDSAYSATRGLAGTALPASAADAAGGLPISDAGGLDLDSVLSGNTPQTGDNYARLGAPAGASVSADIAAIEAQTDDIGAAGAGLTAIPWNAAWDAEVQSEVNDGLVALGLDHLVAASVTGTDITDNSIIAKMASKSGTADWDSFNNTTDSLEAIADSSGAAAVADAVWDETATDHQAAGSMGKLMNDIPDNVWDEVMEAAAPANAQTARQWMRLLAAFIGGEYDSTDTGDWNVKSLDGNTLRITGTLNAGGKRVSVTLDGS